MSFFEQMAGMPAGKKKTRRGRGKGKKPGTDPRTHHTNIGHALDADDHALARSHAFALIKSLPSTAKNASGVDNEDNEPVDAATPVQPAAPAAAMKPAGPAGPSGAAKLAGFLRRKKP